MVELPSVTVALLQLIPITRLRNIRNTAASYNRLQKEKPQLVKVEV